MGSIASPPITWMGTGGNNFWKGRQGNQPIAIVDHISGGTKESMAAWFADPAAQVSAHFSVNRDGSVWQYINLSDTAWANGIEENLDMSVPFLKLYGPGDTNLNTLTVSIEHEGQTGEPLTPAQYQSSVSLHRWLCDSLSIPPDRDHIIGHYQISALSRARCPGSAFPWAQLMRDLAPASPAPATPPEDPNAHHFLLPGVDKWVTNFTDYNTKTYRTGFWDEWQKRGLAVEGYPVTGTYWDTRLGKLVMWTERTRYEYDIATGQFTRGRLGAEVVDAGYDRLIILQDQTIKDLKARLESSQGILQQVAALNEKLNAAQQEIDRINSVNNDLVGVHNADLQIATQQHVDTMAQHKLLTNLDYSIDRIRMESAPYTPNGVNVAGTTDERLARIKVIADDAHNRKNMQEYP